MAQDQPPESEVLESVPLGDEDRFYLEQQYKEPVESLARIEDATKFLGGAKATTSGIFLAAVKMAAGTPDAARMWWFLPLLLWVGIVLALALQRCDVRRGDLSAIKKMTPRARDRNHRWLQAGTATCWRAGATTASS